MATVAELERLTTLTKKLIPISSFQRGTLIRADDWNLLTSSVIELARAVLLESQSATTADHKHADEVDVSWLTPKLRELIEQGGLSDPVANRRLITLERNSEKNSKKIDELLLSLEKIRTNIDDVKVKDIGRESDLTLLRRKFEAKSDSQDEILDLRKSLDGIKDNINKALELGDNISANGEIIDFQALTDEIAGLTDLRNKLIGSDGELLDAKSLEIRLAEIQAKFITQAQFDEGLSEVRNKPPQELVDNLQAELQTTIDSELTTRLSAQTSEYDSRYVNADSFASALNSRDQSLRDEISASSANLDIKIQNGYVTKTSLTDQLQATSQSLSASLGNDIAAQLDSRLVSLSAEYDQRYLSEQKLNTRLAALTTELSSSILNTVRAEIPVAVEQSVQAMAATSLVSKDEFAAEKNNVNTQLTEIRETNNQSITAAVAELSAEFVNKADFDSGLLAQQELFNTTIAESIAQELEPAIAVALEPINDKLNEFSLVETRINTNLKNQLDGLRQDISKISRQTVTTELQGVQTSLLTLQDQVNSINANLSKNINTAITTSLVTVKDDLAAELGVIKQEISRIDLQMLKLRETSTATTGTTSTTSTTTSPTEPVVKQPIADNLTEISGIGPVYEERLLTNNVTTFAEVASMPTTDLAKVLGISEARVVSLEIQPQAKAKLII